MLNRIAIMGRFTRDPELKYTPSGKAVLSFTLACDRDCQPKAGDKKTDFVECVAWNTTAEFISRYFSKGRMAIVSGSLESRKWEAKNGDKRISWEVRVESIYFGDSKRTISAGQMRQARQAQAKRVYRKDLPQSIWTMKICRSKRRLPCSTHLTPR